MEHYTQVSTKMERGMEKESILIQMVHFARVYSEMANSFRVKAQKSTTMETLTQENLKMER